jgi:hypothetical protein
LNIPSPAGIDDWTTTISFDKWDFFELLIPMCYYTGGCVHQSEEKNPWGIFGPDFGRWYWMGVNAAAGQSENWNH